MRGSGCGFVKRDHECVGGVGRPGTWRAAGRCKQAAGMSNLDGVECNGLGQTVYRCS